LFQRSVVCKNTKLTTIKIIVEMFNRGYYRKSFEFRSGVALLRSL